MSKSDLTARPVTRTEMLLGFMGGGIAWFLHLALAYAVAEFGCAAGWGGISYVGLSLVTWLEIAVAVVTTLLAAGAVWITRRVDRQFHEMTDLTLEESRGASQFLVHGGFLLNVLFFIVILVQCVPLFYFLQEC